MASNTQKGRIHWIEDFAGPLDTTDTIFGRCTYTLANATVSALAINGGALRCAITAAEDEALGLFGPLAFEPDESSVISMQARFRTSDHSVSSIFVGWTDAITDSVVIEDEDGTLNTVATDAFGILMEGEQDETWQTIGVDTNTDKTQVAIGAGTDDVTVPDNSTDSNWETVRIEGTAADSGTMRVYLEDGNSQLGLVATRTSYFDSSIVYAPVVSCDSRNAAYNFDVCEFGWDGNAGSSFD
jgi:hypothetical protein